MFGIPDLEFSIPEQRERERERERETPLSRRVRGRTLAADLIYVRRLCIPEQRRELS